MRRGDTRRQAPAEPSSSLCAQLLGGWPEDDWELWATAAVGTAGSHMASIDGQRFSFACSHVSCVTLCACTEAHTLGAILSAAIIEETM